MKYYPLLVNESSILLPNNIQLSKYWLIKTFGNEIVDIIFDLVQNIHSLNLTTTEIALFLPFLLTIDGEYFINSLLTYSHPSLKISVDS
jgi:hypothetical protein